MSIHQVAAPTHGMLNANESIAFQQPRATNATGAVSFSPIGPNDAKVQVTYVGGATQTFVMKNGYGEQLGPTPAVISLSNSGPASINYTAY